jgi:UDP-N-acetylglucosamine:LPS N-acetylglucosamine transferase
MTNIASDFAKPKKILILYAKAGNGHYSQAKALENYLVQFSPNSFEIKLVDGLAGNSDFAQKQFTKGYQLLTSSFYWLWKATYFVYENRFLYGILSLFLKLSSQKYLKKTIAEFKPDLIVDTYFFFSFLDQQHKVAKLVTDIFSPPKAAFFGKNTKYIVFSEEALQVGSGITDSKIYLTPPLVWLQNQANINPNNSVKPSKLLILAGGDSFLGGKQILTTLSKLNPEIKVTLVCGRNEALLKQAQTLKTQKNLLNWQIFGFSKQVPKLISEADLVVTKAGPATIWEILSLKKPMILTSYIWKQELGNKDFVVNQKLGIFEPNPSKLFELVQDFFTNPEKYSLILANLNKLELPKQNGDLAKYLLSL